MKLIRSSVSKAKSSERYGIVLMIVILIFQFTALRFIWNITTIATLVNITLIIISIAFIANGIISRVNVNVAVYYLMPGLLVVVGMSSNLLLSIYTDPSVVNRSGLLIPFVVYLSMPNMIKKGMINSEALWNVYYYFFLFGVSLGLIEYILIFSGYLLPRTIQTPAGTFATGYFSILIPLGSGEIYERFHGFLLEPGSLAMYLLSAMSYAIIYKKYVGLIIFIIGFLLTYSLGGYIGLAMLIPILLFIKARKKVNKLQYISLVSFICIASYFASPLYSDFFLMQYEQKQISSSATDRENATERYLPNMVTLAMDYPFGMRFTRNTVEAEKNRDYFGSTFAPGNAFIHGGILGLFGYILILILSLLISISIFFKKNISDIEIVVGSSLFVMLPFIWQREVIWDTALFPILFAPTILYHLSRLKFNQNAK